MTFIQYAAASARSETSTTPPLAPATAVIGSFCSPSGGVGTFRGSYRLERLVPQFGLLSAAGVFTGLLVDADGSRVGVGSRRQTVAVELSGSRMPLEVRLGPVDVNLLGFLVTMNELTVAVHGASRQRIGYGALRLVDARSSRDEV